jgi:hypothetical protein
MDRVTRSSASRNNLQISEEAHTQPSSAKNHKSAFSSSVRHIGYHAGRVLPAPPTIGEPNLASASLPAVNNPLMAPPLPVIQALVDNSSPAEILQESNKSSIAEMDVELAADGGMHLTFPTAVTDDVLTSFVLFNCESNALNQVTSVSLAFCKNLTGTSLLALNQALPALKSLNLTGCAQLNDDEIFNVSQMVNLKNLTLAGCAGISKSGFINLTNVLDNVEALDLTLCHEVDDTVLNSLPNMYQLKQLILTGCSKFTDNGLTRIGRLKKLESLLLDQCPQISNSSLMRIGAISGTGFKKLNYLDVTNCPRVTRHGIFSLKQTLPWLKNIATNS